MSDFLDGNIHEMVASLMALLFMLGRRFWLRKPMLRSTVDDFALGALLYPYALLSLAVFSSVPVLALLSGQRGMITMSGIMALGVTLVQARKRL